MSDDNDDESTVKCITVFQLAKFRGVKEDDSGCVSMGAFDAVGLPMLGGCQDCGASCAAYNSCPTKNGLLTCLDGIREEDGFETVEKANRFIFPEEYAWLGVNRVAKTEPDQLEYDSTDYSE